MYTMINIISWISFVLLLVGGIAYPIVYFLKYDDQKGKLNYRNLYPNQEEIQEKVDKYKENIKKSWLVIPFIIVALVFGILSGKELSEERCLLSDGEWQTWDSGFGWACVNPDLIEEDRNFRIITDE